MLPPGWAAVPGRLDGVAPPRPTAAAGPGHRLSAGRAPLAVAAVLAARTAPPGRWPELAGACPAPRRVRPAASTTSFWPGHGPRDLGPRLRPDWSPPGGSRWPAGACPAL